MREDRGTDVSADFPEMRASDADRDRVLDMLREAAGDGRLTSDEFDERMEAALSSRTLGELAALTADLGPGPAGRAQPRRRPRTWSGSTSGEVRFSAPGAGWSPGGWSCVRRGAT
jgi:Domain of unknown function (DUF1707)